MILEGIEHVDKVAGAAQRILDIFKTPFVLGNQEACVSTSIGITIYPFDQTDIEQIIKNADTAMYQSKHLGRNNFQFFSEEMNSQAHQRLSLEAQLRAAMTTTSSSFISSPRPIFTAAWSPAWKHCCA